MYGQQKYLPKPMKYFRAAFYANTTLPLKFNAANYLDEYSTKSFGFLQSKIGQNNTLIP